MDRRALEALSSEDLQRLIAEAVAVLAARHAGAGLVDIRKGLNNELNSDFKEKSSPVFQGRGAKRGLDASSSEEEEAETSQQPGSGSAAAPPSRLSASGKRVVVIPCKRSGVKGVTWVPGMNSWRVAWKQDGHHKSRYFLVHRHAEEHRGSYEEADAAALRDAVAFREGLERQGVIKPARAERQSGQQGVHWHRTRGLWTVRMLVRGKTKTCCAFRPKDDTPEEIERARLAAMEWRLKLEAEHGKAVVPETAAPHQESGKDNGAPRLESEKKGGAHHPESEKRDKALRCGPEKNDGALHHGSEEEKDGGGGEPRPRQQLAAPPSRCSGVKGVTWLSSKSAWAVRWREGGDYKSKIFSVPCHSEEHQRSHEERDAEALRDAVAFRKHLVRQGVVRVVRAKQQSGVPGVVWHSRQRRWQARFRAPGRARLTRTFVPSDRTPEEIERARVAAVAWQVKLEAEHREVRARHAAAA